MDKMQINNLVFEDLGSNELMISQTEEETNLEHVLFLTSEEKNALIEFLYFKGN